MLFNDPKTRLLECISEDGSTSKCRCENRSNGKRKVFQIANNDLYVNLNISDLDNVNITDRWINVKPKRIDDCFRLNEPLFWHCKTDSRNFNETHCTCLATFDPKLDAEGFIATRSFYKGLDNITFPSYRKESNHNNSEKNHPIEFTRFSIKFYM